jgi:hypothetical protein
MPAWLTRCQRVQDWSSDQIGPARSLLALCRERAIRATYVATQLAASPEDIAAGTLAQLEVLWSEMQSVPPECHTLSHRERDARFVATLQRVAHLVQQLKAPAMLAALQAQGLETCWPEAINGKVRTCSAAQPFAWPAWPVSIRRIVLVNDCQLLKIWLHHS